MWTWLVHNTTKKLSSISTVKHVIKACTSALLGLAVRGAINLHPPKIGGVMEVLGE